MASDPLPRPGEQEPFARIVRSVARSPAFALYFAVVNSPLQRERLERILRDRLGPERKVVEVDLSAVAAAGGPASVLDVLVDVAGTSGSAGRCVISAWGIEAGFQDSQRASAILSGLNRQREQYASRLGVPLLLWLPEFAVERVAREAPDFWAWRSGVFTFPEDGMAEVFLPAAATGIPAALANLTEEEKRRRIAAHRDLLVRGLDESPGALAQRAALHTEIAQLSAALGEIEDALASYREAERLSRVAGDTKGMLSAAAAVTKLADGGPLVSPPAKEDGRRSTVRVVAGEPKVRDLVIVVHPGPGPAHTVEIDGVDSHSVTLSELVVAPSSPRQRPPHATATRFVDLGKRLATALFKPGTPARERWDQFRDSVRPGFGRVILELHGDASGLPWEAMLGDDGRLLALDYSIVRQSRGSSMAEPGANEPFSGPVRVLVVESDPLLGPGNRENVPPRIDVKSETDRLVSALKKSGRQYSFRRVVPPTLKSLHLELARRGTTIVHFNGHGGLEPPTLCFETETGRLDPVRASEFVSRTSGRAWLVVLSACFSATVLGIAEELARAGIPWVVGMQDAVPVAGARTFVEVFYRYLGEGHSVAEAVRHARIELAAEPWMAALPVLYAGSAAPEAIAALPAGELRDETVEDQARLGRLDNLSALRPATRFLGRERELVQIGERFAAGAAIVTLHGPAGIGKSALAYEAIKRFGWRFAAGVYSVSLAGAAARPGASPLALLGLQMLGQKFSELTPEAQEHHLIEAIRAQPCLVVVDNAEDAVWAPCDAGNVAALRTLRAASSGRGSLLVTTQQVLNWPRESTVEVPGLDPRSGRELFGEYLDDYPFTDADERRLARVLDRLGHHPLAIRLVAPAWRASHATIEGLSSDLDELLAGAVDAAAEKPRHESLDACFGYAYQALTDGDRTWLCRLSLFSAPFLVKAAQAALDASLEAFEPALYRLADRSFLRVHDHGAPTKILEFQPQVRPFVVRQASRENRDLSSDKQRFAAAHATFAASVVQKVATAEWLTTWRLVLVTLPDLRQSVEWAPTDRQRSVMAFSLAEAVGHLGLLDEAMSLYKESLEIAERLSDLRGKAAALHGLAGLHVTRGNLDEAMALYQESLRIKEQLADPQGKAATLHALAGIHVIRGNLGEAMRLYEQSLGIAEQSGDLQGKGAMLQSLAGIHMTLGNVDEAACLYEESLRIAESVGNLRGEAATLHDLANIHRLRGNLDEAMRLYKGSLAISERLGDLQGKGATLRELAVIHRLRGNIDEAVRLYEESLAIMERLDDLRGKGLILSDLASIHQLRGNLDAALRLYQESLGINERLGDLQGKGSTLYSLGRVHLTLGNLDKAQRLYEESLGIMEQLGDLRGKGLALYELASIHRLRGNLDEALRLYEESLGIDERLGDLQSKAVTLSALAGIHRGRGNLDEALRLYEESLRIAERLGDQHSVAVTLAMKGQLLLQTGQVTDGLRALLESRQALMRMKAAEVAQIAGILGAVRERLGEARFESAWREITGDASVPDWVPKPQARRS